MDEDDYKAEMESQSFYVQEKLDDSKEKLKIEIAEILIPYYTSCEQKGLLNLIYQAIDKHL